ncbi:MAG TPA: alpha-glucan family phosphorylase, partial [Opitutaceae bacterium]|nr:alpha-glucan family phosphorylase [Opitutaceae bacterium]
ELWRRLDPSLWELTRHPSVVLQNVSRDRLKGALADPDFRRLVDNLLQAKRQAATVPRWLQKKYPQAPLTCVAYFCMEFMLSEALPIYSGGLGNVAGDQLKAASNLGVPVVGVGLLYQHGYFRQVIDQNGAQQALYPYNDPGQMPVTPVRRENGEWLLIKVELPGSPVWLRAWQVQVGRERLYLLDTNDPSNDPVHRGITSELYGGGPEMRLMQEIVLGVGGWRLLTALGIKPDVCHLNEGHAAFALLERSRCFMREAGQPFEVALMATRAGNLFTTHTAVAAGFDLFSPALVEQYLGRYAKEELGLALRDLLALGRRNPGDDGEPFNMAWLATRGSGTVNGVSRLHGEVSRRIFAPLFPGWPEGEIPVGHVTNGVHMPTWDSAEADALWTKSCGKNRWLGTSDTLESDLRKASAEEIWAVRTASRKSLVEYARATVGRQMAVAGAGSDAIAQIQARLDPGALTLGFARRFATYKRPDLLLHDPDRLIRILRNSRRPVQLIIAGKAHPADQAGQAMILEWTRFIRRTDANPPVVFLADYDMLMAERLVQGIDVWINTPRRPWEASGTSGMKVLVNGGLNLSELDGWWAEAYCPAVGWALGDGHEHGDDPAWDAAEAEALYERLEQEVIPEFYTRDDKGLPAAWVGRIRESMANLTPRFSASRTVKEYTEQHYLPAAAAFRARSADKGAAAMRLVNWRGALASNWGALRFGSVSVDTREGRHAVTVDVHLGAISADVVGVELYADGRSGGAAVRQQMTPVRGQAGNGGARIYSATVPSDRPATDYTARIIPRCEGLSVPLEAGWILWQK